MGIEKEKKVQFDLHFLALSNTPFMTQPHIALATLATLAVPSINYNKNILLIRSVGSTAFSGPVLNEPLSRIISQVLRLATLLKD